MPAGREDFPVARVAALARLKVSPAESALFQDQLTQVLAFVGRAADAALDVPAPDDGRERAPVRERPDEAGEKLHIELPEGRESDTLGGLITEQLGRFPRVGDEVLVDVRDESRRDDDGLPSPAVARLHVTRLDGWRVDRLVLTIEDLDDAEEGGAHA